MGQLGPYLPKPRLWDHHPGPSGPLRMGSALSLLEHDICPCRSHSRHCAQTSAPIHRETASPALTWFVPGLLGGGQETCLHSDSGSICVRAAFLTLTRRE